MKLLNAIACLCGALSIGVFVGWFASTTSVAPSGAASSSKTPKHLAERTLQQKTTLKQRNDNQPASASHYEAAKIQRPSRTGRFVPTQSIVDDGVGLDTASDSVEAIRRSHDLWESKMSEHGQLFQLEEIDVTWAAQASWNIEAVLDDPRLDKLDVSGLDCRSSQCQLTVENGTSEETREQLMQLALLASEDFPKITVKPPHDDDQRTLLYLYRAQ